MSRSVTTINLDSANKEKVKKILDERGMTMSFFFDKCIVNLIEEYEKEDAA